ncbi:MULTISPECIES: hypothetical protein [Mycolicibacterium]|uniref:Uncharacterized protein n=2 Tax=Mycolicibacterium TaxID=1866885 RepID=A0AAW5SFH8_MYCNV|nr:MULTISPECIES: hypothetical protein [Mycolicibacterium]EHB45814.1 hypothetical protein MycrhDRAFT_6292 [Mycolicibacterium rhodesiae JS60]MCV7022870.1 hypothetical protein [Mycolicibacterium novocastrense]MDG5486593.1 hypothetical protein [Mycolicibacterium gadium]GAT12980.1 putative uncharacterized protein [Mycolicibacterium novocastrense]
MTHTAQLIDGDCRAATGESNRLTDRLYWAMSRLVNHGWLVEQFGPDGWSVRDERGRLHTVRAERDGGGRQPVLEVHVGGLLAELVNLPPDDRAAVLRQVDASLRLHMPAGRAHPDDAIQPWHLPSVVGEQPCAEVRRAYWSAVTLTDDYGWQITDVHAEGFDAVTPGATSPTAFRRRRGMGTTADTLAHLLTVMSGHVAQLAALISAHQATTRTIRLPLGGPR